jgi:hypothetical protein
MTNTLFKLFAASAALWWAGSPFAWSLMGSGQEFQEVTFSKAELAQLQIQAGWAKGEDHTLLFEVHNGLKGPIQCDSAQVDLQDGRHIAKSFTPKLFVPPQSTRNASVPQVLKGTLKSYAMSCSCFKKQGQGECVNPLRKD